MPESGQKSTQGNIPGPSPATAPVPTPVPGAARRVGLLVTLVLGGLTALPPLSMDMYLPALPEVTRSRGAPPAPVPRTRPARPARRALGPLGGGPPSGKRGGRAPG
ncbi:Bcr/CflA family drug resistance efflux transporter, partial [Streptomyces sp. NPDC058527]